MGNHRRLAPRKVIGKSRLLGRVDGEVVIVLDLNPSADIRAQEAGLGRNPFCRILVALGTVATATDCDELRACEVIRKRLATRVCPAASTGDPRFFQRHDVVLAKMSQSCLRNVATREEVLTISNVLGVVVVTPS